MMLWLAFVAPVTYYSLKTAAAMRHDLLEPVLGTHADDRLMRLVYPL